MLEGSKIGGIIVKEKRTGLFIALCTLPAFTLYSLFFIYPILDAFKMAFYRWSGLMWGTEVFVGLGNFRDLLEDEIFLKSAVNNLKFALIVPSSIFVISMLFAVLITRTKLKEKNLYRIVFFFPNILSISVVSIVWMKIYEPVTGILNAALRFIGFKDFAQAWLGDTRTALYSIAAAMIWSAIGFYFILFMAGIESIPVQLYEAAVIDGAGEVGQFFKITLPLLWEVVRVSIVFLIGTVFGSFVFVQVMTANTGGPLNSTEVIPSYMYKQAFTQSNLGYATAIGMIMFIIGITMALVSDKITKREAIEF